MPYGALYGHVDRLDVHDQPRTRTGVAPMPDARLREVAERVGIHRARGQQIVGDLESSGYLVKERVGRRNRYTIVRDTHLRHPIQSGTLVGDFRAGT